MTFKSLMNFGGFGKPAYTPIERYHSGPGSYHHGSRGSHKSKAGGSGAALSALTLLAFLFLINVMQQSLQDNNSTAVPMTTVVLRDDELPIVLDTREEKEEKRRTEPMHGSSYREPVKSSKAYVKLENP